MALFHIAVWDQEFKATPESPPDLEIVAHKEFEAESLENALLVAGAFIAGDVLAAQIKPGNGLLVVRRGLAGIVAKVKF